MRPAPSNLMTTHSESAALIPGVRGTWPVYAADDLPNLDFLRTVAVLLVLFGHLTFFHGWVTIGPVSILPMGDLGVKIFFVHTCFVLMLSLERQWKNQGRSEFFVSFMVRRIFRIYPLSISAVLLVSAFRLPLAMIQPAHFVGIPIHLSNFISNLLLVQSDAHGPSILGPMWSLPYEMGMYVLLPFLFLSLYPNKSPVRIFVLWPISIMLCFALSFVSAQPETNIFLTYIPCFLPGVIAYQLQRTRRLTLPAFLWPGVVVTLVVMTLVLLSRLKQSLVLNGRVDSLVLNGWIRSLILKGWVNSWGLCLALGLAVPFFSQISASWLVKTGHVIAKYSYGIYLTHYFCIWLVFERLHFLLPWIMRLALFAVLVTGLPVLFYYLLEEPMVSLGRRLATRSERITAPL
jgi:peptidoglycan/LPS O-acetylase OafA/YrhL